MTTPKIDASLSSMFDVELTRTDMPIDEIKIEAVKASTDNLEAQREYVRGNMVELLEQGKTLFKTMSSIAQSTEQGKDFDVLTKMLKTLIESNAKLLDVEITGKPQDVASANPTAPPEQKAEQITNNTVFVGTTAELSAYMKNRSTFNANPTDNK